MKIFSYGLSFLFVVLLCVPVFAGECKIYPGAKIEEQATEEANQPLPDAKAPKTTVYTSSDSFDAVVSFYRNVAREYVMPDQKEAEEKHLPSGEVLKEAYFIPEGSKDLMNARAWVKVQRPYIGKLGATTPRDCGSPGTSIGKLGTKGLKTTYEDVRDITMIIIVEKQQ